MMYPFLQIDGDTEIVHSDTLPNGEVKVYIEKPDALRTVGRTSAASPRKKLPGIRK